MSTIFIHVHVLFIKVFHQICSCIVQIVLQVFSRSTWVFGVAVFDSLFLEFIIQYCQWELPCLCCNLLRYPSCIVVPFVVYSQVQNLFTFGNHDGFVYLVKNSSLPVTHSIPATFSTIFVDIAISFRRNSCLH